MSTIYLRHPKHGVKMVTLEQEAKHDEAFGWKRYNPDTPSVAEEAAPINELGTRRKYTRKEVPA